MNNLLTSDKPFRIVMLIGLLAVSAEPASTALAAPIDTTVVAPADTTSPRATLESFIDGCNGLYDIISSEHYFDRTSTEHRPSILRVLDCLDLSELPEFERTEFGAEAVVCIKEILDRTDLPPWDEIPDKDELAQAGKDGGPLLTRWRVPGTRLELVKVEEGPQRLEWVFSPNTVARALEHFKDVESLPYRKTGPEISPRFHQWYVSAPGHPVVVRFVDWLPEWFREQSKGLTHWKWLGMILAIILAVLLMIVFYRIYGRLARRYRSGSLLGYWLTIALPILAMLVPLELVGVTRDLLTIRGTPLYTLSFISNLTALLAAMIVVFGVMNRIAMAILASPKINPQGLDAQFIRIVSKLVSVVFCVILFLEGGNFLGIPVTTLIASAGVGGLAVALAAQDTLKNLFGTIMLLSDKPFRVGERIIFDKYDGIVEDIGLRSTRIRLLTGHQASIPNELLANKDIENVGRRPYIRRLADIQIPLDTPREKLEKAVAIIRDSLENHEGMDPDFPPRVFFFDFNPSAFVIRAIYWYNPPQYWDFLALGEKINFEIFRAFEEQDIKFSLPTRITHTSLESAAKPVEVKLLDGGSAA